MFALADKAGEKIVDNDIIFCYEKMVGVRKSCVISVKFLLTEKRDAFMKKVKSLKLSTLDLGMAVKVNIYVNEILSPYYRKLLYNVKVQAKQKGWRPVWIYSGSIMLKRTELDSPIKIQSESDLSVLT